MRVLLISPMPPLIGGVSVSSKRLYDNLKCDGYDVHSYNIHPINSLLNNKLGLFLCFFWIPFFILFHKKYDIIHCHVPGTYRKLYLALCKPLFFKRSKLIFTLHGDVSTLLNKVSIQALKSADRIICVQNGDSQKLPKMLRHISYDIPAFILPKEISEKEIPANILEFVKREDKPTIIFYGSVVFSEKFSDLYGIEDTLDLFETLQKDGVNVQILMLITSNNESHYTFIEKCKDRIKGNENILFVVNAGISMLPLFKYTDLYIRPTKTDGDSLAIRESLSMNCPVVASDKAKRPIGTSVYSNKNEFVRLVKAHLKGSIAVQKQPDFYQKIKQNYEFD